MNQSARAFYRCMGASILEDCPLKLRHGEKLTQLAFCTPFLGRTIEE
ncbi:hypothetical protein [Coleofasciculus sp. H7-2]